MYGRTAVIGETVNTEVWNGARYTGVVPGTVVSIQGDGRTQGTMEIRRASGRTETVSARRVHPQPEKKTVRRGGKSG